MNLSKMLLFFTAILAVYLLLPYSAGASEPLKKPTLVDLMTPS